MVAGDRAPAPGTAPGTAPAPGTPAACSAAFVPGISNAKCNDPCDVGSEKNPGD